MNISTGVMTVIVMIFIILCIGAGLVEFFNH